MNTTDPEVLLRAVFGWRDIIDRSPITTAERRERLADRCRRVIQHDPRARLLLAAVWPSGVATFAETDVHTDDELLAIDRVIGAVEAEVEAPF